VWCEQQPLPVPPRSLRGLARTLASPRGHLSGAWHPPDGATLLVDGRDSWPAVPAGARAAVVVHHAVLADARAVRRVSPGTVQDRRLERRAVTAAGPASAALSDRVRRAVGAAGVVPATVPLPPQPLPLVERPVALLLADWTWRPNALALTALLRLWPRVRSTVAGAELLVAGRGAAPTDAGVLLPGVRLVGAVSDTTEVMAGAAVLAFPCPTSSGPKLKVLDAVLHGLPVVTTPAGVEGLAVTGVTAAAPGDFAAALAGALADPAGRARSAATARRSALETHSPAVAARAWATFLDPYPDPGPGPG
jgi:hypothetical protein